MSRKLICQLRALEGHHVGISLRDGSRIDDCQLVSAGRGRVPSVWIFSHRADVFLTLDDITEVWEENGNNQASDTYAARVRRSA